MKPLFSVFCTAACVFTLIHFLFYRGGTPPPSPPWYVHLSYSREHDVVVSIIGASPPRMFVMRNGVMSEINPGLSNHLLPGDGSIMITNSAEKIP